MNVLIIGVGAIGSVYLSFLTKAGHNAVGLLKGKEKIETMSVSGIWGKFETRVKCITGLSELDFIPELTIISVKSYDTEKALDVAEIPVREGSKLLLLQNGYGNYEKAVRKFGEGVTILSRVIFGAVKNKLNDVTVTVCADDVIIGDPSGTIEEGYMKKLASTFTKAGIPTRYDPGVYKYLWDKIIYNSALNPLGALLEVNYGSVVSNEGTRKIVESIIDEIFEVIKNHRIETFWSSPLEYKKKFYTEMVPPTEAHYPSMLYDIKKGKTEIDSLNGAICYLGDKAGVDVPVNRTITNLVKAKENLFKGNRGRL